MASLIKKEMSTSGPPPPPSRAVELSPRPTDRLTEDTAWFGRKCWIGFHFLFTYVQMQAAKPVKVGSIGIYQLPARRRGVPLTGCVFVSTLSKRSSGLFPSLTLAHFPPLSTPLCWCSAFSRLNGSGLHVAYRLATVGLGEHMENEIADLQQRVDLCKHEQPDDDWCRSWINCRQAYACCLIPVHVCVLVYCNVAKAAALTESMWN